MTATWIRLGRRARGSAAQEREVAGCHASQPPLPVSSIAAAISHGSASTGHAVSRRRRRGEQSQPCPRRELGSSGEGCRAAPLRLRRRATRQEARLELWQRHNLARRATSSRSWRRQWGSGRRRRDLRQGGLDHGAKGGAEWNSLRLGRRSSGTEERAGGGAGEDLGAVVGAGERWPSASGRATRESGV